MEVLAFRSTFLEPSTALWTTLGILVAEVMRGAGVDLPRNFPRELRKRGRAETCGKVSMTRIFAPSPGKP